MSQLILETNELPESLWNPVPHLEERSPKGVLTLPFSLTDSYVEILTELNLLDHARNTTRATREGKGPIGGITPEESRIHFAEAFSGSCGRTQLFCLDPHLTFKSTRKALLELFSFERITILDIPSGAGSGSATLLSIIYQLRREGLLPTTELDVHVIGGDISETSCDIATRVFRSLTPKWLDGGISVTSQFSRWDIESDESTEELLQLWANTFPNRHGLLLGNNFSGFLGEYLNGKMRIEEVETGLRMIFAKSSYMGFNTFWLEPATKRAGRMFPKMNEKIFKKYTRIKPALDEFPQSSAVLIDPIFQGGHFTTRSVGVHLKPVRS